jgi:integrase
VPGRRQQGEGSLYHRKDRDQWVAVADLGWKAGKRDRREFTGPDPASALEKRARFLDTRRDGFTLPRGRQPTVSEWVLHWCYVTAKAQVDANTWHRSYRQKCKDYIAPYFEKVLLTELSAEDIEDWHAAMLARPSKRGGGTLSPSTVVTAHRIFSACLNEAVRRKRMAVNPCSIVTPPRADRDAPEPPSADEVDTVLAACADWPNGARWVLAVTTGLRQGEALGLRWRDVQLAAPASVAVRKPQKRIDGEWVYGDPKSRKSRRSVPLPKVAADALKAHRERQGVADIGGLVFLRQADAEGHTGRRTMTGQPVHSKADWQDWQDLLASLGLPHYRVHDLRHGYATELLEQGEDPRVVQDLMGWSTAAMAEIYQHVRPVTHARVVSSLDRRFGG